MDRNIVVLLLLLPAVALFPAALTSQQETVVPETPAHAATVDGWNTARALELIQRAQLRRSETQADTGLLSYRADARGYVYFYLDRRDTGERNLVKTDQVALEVFWRAPDLIKQRIAGWRDERTLPTNIQYHIDHLAVVHDNFGDLIRIGDGDEVSDVLHPAAPGAENFYHYRLADSLTLRLPGVPEPVRVYELQVRPRDLRQPALLGSVFVDRRSGAIVRMDFTFTAASYVDRNLDHINISLDNGLWKGRFWLPNQQRLEIRRQIPELDIPAGSVIRGTMRVGNYRFNENLPLTLFHGPPVVVAPRAERENFPFEEDIFAELRAEGIGPQTELLDIRRQALALAGTQRLSGLPAVRLSLGAASDLFRYNRAEGAVLAPGISLSPAPALTARLRGGWAFGAGQPVADARLGWQQGTWRLAGLGYLNQPRDVGVSPAASGAINTLSAFLAGRDYTDLYYARGGGIEARWFAAPGWSLTGTLRLEEHASAALDSDFAIFGPATLRRVHEVDDGTLLGGTLELRRFAPAEANRWWGAALHNRGGSLSTHLPLAPEERLGFLRSQVEANAGTRLGAGDAELEVRGAAGFALGTLPRQELFLLGGRGTLPGYEFRGFGGDRFALAGATASTNLWSPWLRGRLLGAAGWTGVGTAAERALHLWGADTTDGLRASAGVGVGIFYDILRVDLHRGLGGGGGWELIVETRRSFWDFL